MVISKYIVTFLSPDSLSNKKFVETATKNTDSMKIVEKKYDELINRLHGRQKLKRTRPVTKEK